MTDLIVYDVCRDRDDGGTDIVCTMMTKPGAKHRAAELDAWAGLAGSRYDEDDGHYVRSRRIKRGK